MIVMWRRFIACLHRFHDNPSGGDLAHLSLGLELTKVGAALHSDGFNTKEQEALKRVNTGSKN